MTNFTNSAILSSWTFSGTSFSADIINNGTISPGGLVVSNSSIAGQIEDGGVIIGGIRIVGSTITGGIANAGLVEIDGTGFVDGGISLDSQSLLAVGTGTAFWSAIL
jgi:hypothetical protein